MRKFLAITICAAALGLPTYALAEREPDIIATSEIAVGDISFVKLPGNPDLGYKWRLNSEKSRGLEFVQVDKIGWLKGQQKRSLFAEARSRLNILLTGKAAGQAEVAFDYYKYFGGRLISRTSFIQVTVKPKSSKQ